jgi:pimeloyl-ACP methyl ester carboxylesterase
MGTAVPGLSVYFGAENAIDVGVTVRHDSSVLRFDGVVLTPCRALLAVCAILACALISCHDSQTPLEADGPGEDGAAELSHHFVEVAGLTWHYVEAGQGEPVVFLHGLPESWYSWHYQLEALSDDYRVIAIDLKGYGQSDKSDGGYSADQVAEEVLTLLDTIGLERFNLVTHDWGTLLGDFIAGRHPERVIRYIRMQAPVHKSDPQNHPQFVLLRNQELAIKLFSEAEAFIRRVYDERTIQPIPEEDMLRVIEEFGRPGVAEAVPRYFRDTSAETLLARQQLYSQMNFPVLLLQGEKDPAQPQWYFEGAAAQFPDAELQWVMNAGHFTELEQPEQVTKAIRDFLQR